MKLWSEVSGARARELAADVATLAWVWVWGGAAWRLYGLLSEYRGVGQTIRDGGANITNAGVDVSNALAGVPLVGADVSRISRDAFAEVGLPFAQFGTELEQFVTLVAITLALLLALVTLLPWLARYLPWRLERVRGLRAAHRAIRLAPAVPDADVQRVLASRAVHRLSYADLLEFTPDPVGDWVAGRHERLARAELASVGLRPRQSKSKMEFES